MFNSRAARAYDAGAKATASSRELEAAALYKGARLLEACQQGWDAPDRARRLGEALRYNQKLWTLFQTELVRPDHQMPAGLRINLLRLSGFVDRRIFDVMAGPEPRKLSALIDINRNIAAGLSAEPAARKAA
jgi:flagellar protein FlaF